MAPEIAIFLYWAFLFILGTIVFAAVLYWVIRKAVKRAIIEARKELDANSPQP